MDFTLKILRKITLPNAAFTMRAIRLHFSELAYLAKSSTARH